MAKKSGGKSGSAAVGDLYKGLTTSMPSASDASTKLMGPSVNSEATRTGVLPSSATLGPRTA